MVSRLFQGGVHVFFFQGDSMVFQGFPGYFRGVHSAMLPSFEIRI